MYGFGWYLNGYLMSSRKDRLVSHCQIINASTNENDISLTVSLLHSALIFQLQPALLPHRAIDTSKSPFASRYFSTSTRYYTATCNAPIFVSPSLLRQIQRMPLIFLRQINCEQRLISLITVSRHYPI